MPVLHFSRSPALPRAMMIGLILLVGCSGSANETAPKASSTRATDARPTETHGPELVAAMLRLSFVGCVDRSGPERPIRHTLVHLRDV
ncbi:MAG TPA: hypothetical protein VHB77_10570, partial [Planctomycetaceae bacterium]|nr:hypothetical protein [Planctomycetaceae bacterium]